VNAVTGKAVLVAVHGFGFAQHLAVDVVRDRRASSTCEFGGLLEHGGDGVSGQLERSPTVQPVEQGRPREFGDVRMELVEVDVQVLDGLPGNACCGNSEPRRPGRATNWAAGPRRTVR
jgi:hypothetical protein